MGAAGLLLVDAVTGSQFNLCPVCTDYHCAVRADPLVHYQCATCGERYPVRCHRCGAVVRETVERVNSAGLRIVGLRCGACGDSHHGWVKLTSRRRSALALRVQRPKCQRCHVDAPDGNADHIIALSLGGEDILANTWWLCRECHARKTKQDRQRLRERRRNADA